MIITPTFDTTSQTLAAPPGFYQAVNEAIQLVCGKFAGNNLNITIQFGYGSIANSAAALTTSGGQSEYFLFEAGSGTTVLSSLKTGLTTNAKTQYAIAAANSIPTVTDPTGGATMWLTNAQAACLGLTTLSPGTLIGFIGIVNNITFFWSREKGAQSGYDAVGMLVHEITENLGRDGFKLTSFAGTTSYYPFDLFSYTAPGTRNFTSYAASYVSHDGGVTHLNTTSTTGSSDTMDWNGVTNDSFNTISSSGVINTMSINDIITMDGLGYQAGPLYAVSGSGVGKGF